MANLAEYTSWLYPDTNGDFYLIDPQTQEQLRGNMPHCVLANRRLQTGLEAYQTHDVDVILALIRHTKTQDVDRPGDRRWLERTTSDPALDVFGYEFFGNFPGADFIARRRGKSLATSFGEFESLNQRLWSALYKSPAISGPFDIGNFYPIERTAVALHKGLETLQEFVYTNLAPVKESREYLQRESVANYLRESIMPAKLGMLVNRSARQKRVIGKAPVKALMLVGATHADQERQLTKLGANVTPLHFTYDYEPPCLLDKVMASGVITTDDFEAHREYTLQILTHFKLL